MSKEIVSIPLSCIQRVEIKVTNCRKTMAQVKSETGAAYILNGGMWNADGSPCPLLKVGGKNLSSFPWSAYGYSWNTGPDIHMTAQHNEKNFIAVTPLLKDRTPIEKLSYSYAQGGKRGRSAMGLKDGALCLYCSGDGTADAKTPEQLREELYALGWESAVMLDGGGSSQCDFDGQTITASRKVHNWICVYTKKEEEDKPVKKTVCLDPGHGPDTVNGSPDGTYKEREFAWDLYERIVPLLEAQGVNVICTRTEDTKPSLTERATVANNAKADCFVSLHTNAEGGTGWGTAHGLEIYTSSGPTSAPRNVLAQDILDEMEAAGVTLRSSPLVHDLSLTVLAKTNMPAVLIEYGFHTNRADVTLLLSDVYREKLAEATARGVCAWLGIAYHDKEESAVEEKPWYADAQAWAVQMGIADGTRPTDPCTRAEEWTMLQRLYNLIKEGK